MNSQPIYVVIKDNCNLARSLTWLANGAKWLPANGSITLDYDPWSCASVAQRTSIASAVASGAVTMTIHVLNDTGSYSEVRYCPGATAVKPFVTVDSPVPAAAPAGVYVYQPSASVTVDSPHTVVAGVNRTAAQLGLRVETVTPPAASGGSAYGFSTVDSPAPPQAAAGFDKKAAAAVSVPEPEPVPEEPAATAQDDAAAADDKDRYNALVADKKWADAYRLLKAHFGEDRITFSQRSLQYVADWDALVAKYGLE